MNKEELNLGIIRIRDLEFLINEELDPKDPQKVGITFEFNSAFRQEVNEVDFCITISFFKKSDSALLMKIKVCTTFIIVELKEIFDKESGGYDIPDNILLTMLSLSITHARAIHAVRAASTVYSTLLIPIVNPQDMYNHFFKKNGA